MPRVKVTTTDGELYEVACPGVDSADIDAAFIEQRTGYDVDSVEVDDPDADLEAAIRNADTLEELKAALVGDADGAKARARRP